MPGRLRFLELTGDRMGVGSYYDAVAGDAI